MPDSKTERSPFVGKVPALRNKKWGGMENEEAAAIVAEILKGGKPALRQLVDGLQEIDDGSDWQERLLIDMVVGAVSPAERAGERGQVVATLVEAALEDRPASVTSFLLHELRLVADASVAPQLVPLLRSGDRLVADAAAVVMVSIGAEAEGALKKAQEGAEGHARTAIQHALHQIS